MVLTSVISDASLCYATSTATILFFKQPYIQILKIKIFYVLW